MVDSWIVLDDYFYSQIDEALRKAMAEPSYASYTFDDTVSVVEGYLPYGFVATYGHDNVVTGIKLRIGVVAGLRSDTVWKPSYVDPVELNRALEDGTPITELMYQPGEIVPTYTVEELPGTEDERILTVEGHASGDPIKILDENGDPVTLRTLDDLIQARTERIGPDWLIDIKETVLGTREAGTFGKTGEGLLGGVEKRLGLPDLADWLSKFKFPEIKIPFGSFYIIAGILVLVFLAFVLWSPGGRAAGRMAGG